MKKINLFDCGVWVAKSENHKQVKQYIYDKIIPTYLEHSKKQNNNYKDFQHGAELGGAFNHLSIIDDMDKNWQGDWRFDKEENKEEKQNLLDYQEDGNDGLETVYSDYFPGAVQVDIPYLSKLYTPDIRAIMLAHGFRKDIKWFFNGYYWYNITEKGGFQDTHDHIMGPRSNTICGIHHIEFDHKVLSPAFFINPQEQIMRATYPSEDTKNVPESFKNLISTTKVKESDIIWFRPWMKHTVAKQKSEKRRITMAMDIVISDKKVDKNSVEIDLND